MSDPNAWHARYPTLRHRPAPASRARRARRRFPHPVHGPPSAGQRRRCGRCPGTALPRALDLREALATGTDTGNARARLGTGGAPGRGRPPAVRRALALRCRTGQGPAPGRRLPAAERPVVAARRVRAGGVGTGRARRDRHLVPPDAGVVGMGWPRGALPARPALKAPRHASPGRLFPPMKPDTPSVRSCPRALVRARSRPGP